MRFALLLIFLFPSLLQADRNDFTWGEKAPFAGSEESETIVLHHSEAMRRTQGVWAEGGVDWGEGWSSKSGEPCFTVWNLASSGWKPGTYGIHINWGSSDQKARRAIRIYVAANETDLETAILANEPRLSIEASSAEAWAVGWSSDSPEATPGWKIAASREDNAGTELLLQKTDTVLAVRTQDREGFAHAFNGMVLELIAAD